MRGTFSGMPSVESDQERYFNISTGRNEDDALDGFNARSGSNPDFLLGGRTSASAESRHWSGRAVRLSSCAILLRPGPAAGEAGRPPEPATMAATNKCLARSNKSRTGDQRD